MKRFWALFFALMLCVALPASAAGEATTTTGLGEVTTCETEGADVPVPNVLTSSGGIGEVTVQQEAAIETSDADIAASFSLTTGKSWSEDFSTSALLDGDENGFQVVFTNCDAKEYKYIIIGSDGYTYESAELSGDAVFLTMDAQAGVTYTVYLINADVGDSSWAVTISGCCVS